MARKLIGDLQPGDMVMTAAGDPIKVTGAYHNSIMEAREGKAWIVELEGAGPVQLNSLDEIELAPEVTA